MVVRTAELKKLEQIASTEGEHLVLLYGTIYSGAKALLRQFVRDKECFYVAMRDTSKEEQKRMFIRDVVKTFPGSEVPVTYTDCFKRMQKSGGRLIIAIDDFQNVLKADDGFWEELSAAKANGVFSSNVMIVLMINELSHLFKEGDEYLPDKKHVIEDRICLTSVPFLDIVRAFPEYSVKEAVETFGIVGGNHDLIDKWSRKRSVKENVIYTMLTPSGSMFDAAKALLSSELRELSVYQTLLLSIARGNEKLNDLFKDTGFSRAKIIVYLKNLEAFDIVEKVVSFDTGGWENAKKGVYRIKNPYINFYYKFIYPNLSDLEMMEPEKFYNTYIEPGLDEYLRWTFIKVCDEYISILNMMGKTPIEISRTGIWIGKEGTIDVIGQDSVRNNIVAKTNYDKAEFPYSDYEKLVDSMDKAKITAKAIYLFSATEFDSRLKDLAKRDNSIVLVDMKEL
jgi:AAA+ ATPase superfamily predicted ATPase